jgi:hypothetical protein
MDSVAGPSTAQAVASTSSLPELTPAHPNDKSTQMGWPLFHDYSSDCNICDFCQICCNYCLCDSELNPEMLEYERKML